MYTCILVVINIFMPTHYPTWCQKFWVELWPATMLQWVITVLSLCERRWNNLLMPSLYGFTLVTSSVQPQHYSQSNRLVKWIIQTIKMLLYTRQSWSLPVFLAPAPHAVLEQLKLYGALSAQQNFWWGNRQLRTNIPTDTPKSQLAM